MVKIKQKKFMRYRRKEDGEIKYREKNKDVENFISKHLKKYFGTGHKIIAHTVYLRYKRFTNRENVVSQHTFYNALRNNGFILFPSSVPQEGLKVYHCQYKEI